MKIKLKIADTLDIKTLLRARKELRKYKVYNFKGYVFVKPKMIKTELQLIRFSKVEDIKKWDRRSNS